MVKTVLVSCFVLLLAIPALAQDDYPKIYTSMGYANLSLPDPITGDNGHRSGFANSTGLNLSRTFGVENYMGIYSLGSSSGSSASMIADFIGGTANYRAAKIAPYGLGAIGFAYCSICGITSGITPSYYGQSFFATRFGGGVNVPINDILSWKVEVSRMSFHFPSPGSSSSWTSGTNIQGGIQFTLLN